MRSRRPTRTAAALAGMRTEIAAEASWTTMSRPLPSRRPDPAVVMPSMVTVPPDTMAPAIETAGDGVGLGLGVRVCDGPTEGEDDGDGRTDGDGDADSEGDAETDGDGSARRTTSAPCRSQSR